MTFDHIMSTNKSQIERSVLYFFNPRTVAPFLIKFNMKNLYLKLLFIITSFIATEAWATTEETVIDGITYEITY